MRRNANRIATIISVALICMSWGCAEKKNDKNEQNARELYGKSLATARLYADSLRNAKDSAEILRLDKAFDAAITHLNFSYPAETFLEVSEGENDTLTNVTLRFVELRDSLLYRLAHPVAAIDTTETGTDKEPTPKS